MFRMCALVAAISLPGVLTLEFRKREIARSRMQNLHESQAMPYRITASNPQFDTLRCRQNVA